MPRIEPLELENANLETRAILDGVRAKIGMVPNLYATFAQSPAVLKAFLGFSEALAEGRLSAAQRETIALAVGQANRCQYCVSAHTLIAKGAGLDQPAIESARSGEDGDAIAALAARIVNRQGQLSDADLDLARAEGLDDGLIVEIIAQVALNVLTNYSNHIADTEIDFPLVEMD